jgi:hypothetical protein
VPFHDQLVEIVGLGGVERVEGEVVHHEQVDRDELPQVCLHGVVEPGGLQPLEHLVRPFDVHAVATATGDVPESGREERLARADRDSDRLHHLRRLLPYEVRVTSAVHPLFGRLLPATGFKRIDGSLFLVVGPPGKVVGRFRDLSPGAVRAGGHVRWVRA